MKLKKQNVVCAHELSWFTKKSSSNKFDQQIWNILLTTIFNNMTSSLQWLQCIFLIDAVFKLVRKPQICAHWRVVAVNQWLYVQTTDIEKRSQKSCTALCNDVVSHEAPLGGIRPRSSRAICGVSHVFYFLAQIAAYMHLMNLSYVNHRKPLIPPTGACRGCCHLVTQLFLTQVRLTRMTLLFLTRLWKEKSALCFFFFKSWVVIYFTPQRPV